MFRSVDGFFGPRDFIGLETKEESVESTKIGRLRRINKYTSEIGRPLARKRKDDKRDCCRVSVGRVCTTTRVVYRIRNVKYLSERGVA